MSEHIEDAPGYGRIIPGIYPNLDIETYHGHKESISRSALMDFEVSPYNYWALHINPARPPKRETKALDLGQALHDMILSPEIFAAQYEVEPPRVLLKDAGRDLYDEYKKEVERLEKSNSTILSFADFELLGEMEDALNRHPNAMELIKGAVYESSYFWKDKETGLMLKARPDIKHKNMIVDFKTTKDASPRGFQRAMMEYGYHYQAAYIQDGVEALEGRFIPDFINICIEKVYPYHIGIYIIGEDALEAGRKKYKQLLLDLKNATVHNKWPDFEAQTINLPAWAQ